MRPNLLLASFLWIALTAPVRAELIPSFNLDRAVGQCEAVVHGKLDAAGELHVLDVLKGKFGKTVRIMDGELVFQSFQSIAKEKSFEVVLFLRHNPNNGWRLVNTVHGVVVFHKDRVYLFEGTDKGRRLDTGFGPTDQLPTAYITEVRRTLAAFQERERLVTLPRSPERTRHVLAFLRAQPQPSVHTHMWTLVRLLEPADGKAILIELKTTKRDAERVILLDVVRRIPLGKDVYEEVSPWAKATQAPETRRAAFAALAAVDPYRMAGEYGLALRRPDELQLVDVLQRLSSLTRDYPHVPKHRNVLEGLVLLTGQVRHAQREKGGHDFSNESHALLEALACYAHPRHLPALMDWAFAEDQGIANWALSTLQNTTGLKYTREQRASWNAWYKEALPVLSREYVLATNREHRAAWLEAYAQADSATRRLLLTLWHFEETIDEGWLVTAARGKLGAPAKTVLADLWNVKRLAPTAKQDVLEHFLKVRLIEKPNPHRDVPTWRELQIIVEPDFPFPADAWFDNRYSIVIGNKFDPKIDDGSSGTFSIGNRKEPGPFMVGSMGGGGHAGAPTARAILQLGEVEPSSGGRLNWTKRWELGPLVLENRPLPKLQKN